jgi:hypothetical protein
MLSTGSPTCDTRQPPCSKDSTGLAYLLSMPICVITICIVMAYASPSFTPLEKYTLYIRSPIEVGSAFFDLCIRYEVSCPCVAWRRFIVMSHQSGRTKCYRVSPTIRAPPVLVLIQPIPDDGAVDVSLSSALSILINRSLKCPTRQLTWRRC